MTETCVQAIIENSREFKFVLHAPARCPSCWSTVKTIIRGVPLCATAVEIRTDIEPMDKKRCLKGLVLVIILPKSRPSRTERDGAIARDSY